MMYRMFRTARWLGPVLALSGCGSVKNSAMDAGVADAAPRDAPGVCDPLAPFNAPAPVPGLAIPGLGEGFPQLSPDELTIYFDGAQAGAEPRLYTAHRTARTEAFKPPTLMPAQGAEGSTGNASVSSDGLTLWLAHRPTTQDVYHLYVATRGSALAEFAMPGLAQVVNTSEAASDAQPFLTQDGQELWFISYRAPSMDADIWRARRTGTSFAPPERVPEVNSPSIDYAPTLSADQLTIYVSSARTGGKGDFDVWRAHRSKSTDPFPTPTRVDELSTAKRDFANWISADNCRLYGASDSGGGGLQIYMASRSR